MAFLGFLNGGHPLEPLIHSELQGAFCFILFIHYINSCGA